MYQLLGKRMTRLARFYSYHTGKVQFTLCLTELCCTTITMTHFLIITTRGKSHHNRMVNEQDREILTCQMIVSGNSSICSLYLELRLWVNTGVVKHGGRGVITQE